MVFAGLCLAGPATAGVTVTSWQPSQNLRTHDPQISLALQKTKLAGFNLHTLGFTQTIWRYSIILRGDRETYAADQISLSNFQLQNLNAKKLAVTSGTVRLDRSKNKITISLQVSREGTIEEFEGNGIHDLPRNS